MRGCYFELGCCSCIIEDKTGLKQNSLFGTDRVQVLEDIDVFCEKIQAGRAARRKCRQSIFYFHPPHDAAPSLT